MKTILGSDILIKLGKAIKDGETLQEWAISVTIDGRVYLHVTVNGGRTRTYDL